jgi:proline iminopeptidase
MVEDLVTVHRYDQRGSGRSVAHPPYHLADFITDLEALREHWRRERWVVAGHSWGAQLALL